jgi:hypothetical protein
MAKALTLSAQALLRIGLEPFRSRKELTELGNVGGVPGCVADDLLVRAPGRDVCAPRTSELAPQAMLLVTNERVEDVELERRPSEAPLFELARHREEALHERSELLPRNAPAPRVCPRPAVDEDSTSRDETALALGPKLGDGVETAFLEEAVGKIELGLDVRLAGTGANVARVAARTEKKPDRLRKDRLPRPGFAGYRVHSGRESKLRLPNQDEVLDSEAPEHPAYAKTS